MKIEKSWFTSSLLRPTEVSDLPRKLPRISCKLHDWVDFCLSVLLFGGDCDEHWVGDGIGTDLKLFMKIEKSWFTSSLLRPTEVSDLPRKLSMKLENIRSLSALEGSALLRIWVRVSVKLRDWVVWTGWVNFCSSVLSCVLLSFVNGNLTSCSSLNCFWARLISVVPNILWNTFNACSSVLSTSDGHVDLDVLSSSETTPTLSGDNSSFSAFWIGDLIVGLPNVFPRRAPIICCIVSFPTLGGDDFSFSIFWIGDLIVGLTNVFPKASIIWCIVIVSWSINPFPEVLNKLLRSCDDIGALSSTVDLLAANVIPILNKSLRSGVVVLIFDWSLDSNSSGNFIWDWFPFDSKLTPTPSPTPSPSPSPSLTPSPTLSPSPMRLGLTVIVLDSGEDWDEFVLDISIMSWSVVTLTLLAVKTGVDDFELDIGLRKEVEYIIIYCKKKNKSIFLQWARSKSINYLFGKF